MTMEKLQQTPNHFKSYNTNIHGRSLLFVLRIKSQ